MAQLLELKEKIIYGPVNSRRLGRSLGINLFPGKVKICSFNCCYCQYGWTDFSVFASNDYTAALPGSDAVIAALAKALGDLSEEPAYLTFSGNGEATLHPDFAQIIDKVIVLRDRLAPAARTAILSNSSTVNQPEVRRGLARLDCRIMKLDCGSPPFFQHFNQPHPGIAWESVVAGLEALSREAGVVIQTLVAGGEGGNDREENISGWIGCLKQIKPRSVQLYSLARGYPAAGLRPLSRGELERIQARAESIMVEIY